IFPRYWAELPAIADNRSAIARAEQVRLARRATMTFWDASPRTNARRRSSSDSICAGHGCAGAAATFCK
ncbi:hypothetical protein, partial [Xanthomonas maliensis]|uniref:hypothetical protein n=1 Tax=Xanthomonas maliensis TaxID=1321368 RepID=UPI001EE3349D